MWQTPKGLRHLQGAEADLLKEAIGVIWDQVEEGISDPENDWACGIEVFDSLDGRQKVALLAFVSQALFREDVPTPPLNAINEAAIGVIFESLPVNVEIEIDGEGLDWPAGSPSMDLYHWRRLIRSAFIADGVPVGFPVPAENCCDSTQWDLLIECLSDQLLWDDDWADDGFIMDVDPDTAADRKRRLGINDDYYLAVAPDPNDDELERARQVLRQLVGDNAGT